MMRTSRATSKEGAFALIEVVILIALVMILSGFIVSAFSGLTKSAKQYNTFTLDYLESRLTDSWGDYSAVNNEE